VKKNRKVNETIQGREGATATATATAATTARARKKQQQTCGDGLRHKMV